MFKCVIMAWFFECLFIFKLTRFVSICLVWVYKTLLKRSSLHGGRLVWKPQNENPYYFNAYLMILGMSFKIERVAASFYEISSFNRKLEKVLPKDKHGNYHVFIMDNSCEIAECSKKWQNGSDPPTTTLRLWWLHVQI